ncbi:hypothetical protein EVAR_56272_1 [Eumeta japonica]|uniref:Uncharacterized protein n=1 Tax=Eumeta variegata TaxID=151549 RepID=A0A4C1YF06_EUMVA|nr:hypothetical protein EVAR_56272_1 [Eumeta japonica]
MIYGAGIALPDPSFVSAMFLFYAIAHCDAFVTNFTAAEFLPVADRSRAGPQLWLGGGRSMSHESRREFDSYSIDFRLEFTSLR